MITMPQNHQTCTRKICLTHSPLLLIRWGASQVQFLFYGNEPIRLAHHSEKKKPWRLPQIKGFNLKYSVSPLWASYKGKRRTAFAKAYGIKVRCYRELFGEHVRNLGNSLPPPPNGGKKSLHGKWTVDSWLSTPNTTWKKPYPSPPTHKTKKGDLSPLPSMTWLLIGCMEILFLKLAATIFGLD